MNPSFVHGMIFEEGSISADDLHRLSGSILGGGEAGQHGANLTTGGHGRLGHAGFVQTLRLQRFVLVGHSMGGAIAGVYAAEHPEHVAELALVDAFGLKATPNELAREVQAGNGGRAWQEAG